MRSRSAIEFQDVAAATFVVGNDLQVADFTSLSDAIANLPVDGGSVFCLTPATVSSAITLPDKDVTVSWASGATYTFTGTGNLFLIPNGLTAQRLYIFRDPSPLGDGVSNQTFLECADAGGFPKVEIHSPWISGFKRAFNISAGDVTYIESVVIKIFGGFIIPPTLDGSSILIATAGAYSSNTYPSSVQVDHVGLYDSASGFFNGWHFDCDSELILTTSRLDIIGTNQISGFSANAESAVQGAIGDGNDSLKAAGGSDVATLGGSKFWLADVQFIMADEGAISDVLLFRFSKIIVLGGLGSRQSLIGVVQSEIGTSNPDIVIDVQSTNHTVIVGAILGRATTALIKNASVGTEITGCHFIATGGVNTVLDSGSGVSVIDGCYGLLTGGGLSLNSGSSVEGATLASVSSSSTNALVTVVPQIQNPKGLLGAGWVKNTDGANSIDVKESFTDAFGTTSTLTSTVTAGNTLPLNLGIVIGTGFPPYVSYKVEIIDTVAGNHATYSVRFTSQGAV